MIGICCEHDSSDHGQERQFYECDDSRREVCLKCPDYADESDQILYPHGKAWHRFKAAAGQEGGDAD